MKCLSQDLTKRQIFERIDKYSRGQLTPKQAETFEKHFWICSACYEALLLHRLTLKVVKEYGNQIFPEAKKSKIKEETISALSLTKDGKEINNIPIGKPNFSWSMELFEAGLYAIIYLLGSRKHVLWQKQIASASRKRTLFGERLFAPSQPEIEKIQIPEGEGTKKKEIIVSIEQKKEKFILSLTAKKNIVM